MPAFPGSANRRLRSEYARAAFGIIHVGNQVAERRVPKESDPIVREQEHMSSLPPTTGPALHPLSQRRTIPSACSNPYSAPIKPS